MRDRLERRRLTRRAAALCIVLVLLCGCLLPAFAEGPERTDSVPDQTWGEEIEDEPAWDEEEDIRTDEPVLLPAEGGIPAVVDGLDDIGLPDETPTPDSGAVKADEHFERTYLFWLSESDEADGGLPYAEQTVGSGEELLMPEEPEVEGKSFRFWYSRDDEGTAVRFVPTSPFCRCCGKNGPPPRRKRLRMRQSRPKKADPLRKMPTWPTTA